MNMQLVTVIVASLSLWLTTYGASAAVPEQSFDPTKFESLQKCIDAASKWGRAEKGCGVVVLTGTVTKVPKVLELGSNVRLQGPTTGTRATLHFTGPQCASDKEVSAVVHVAAGESGITISHIDFTRAVPGQGGGGYGGIFRTDVAVAV